MSDSENREDLKITLGIEEEFFLVDPDSRDLIADPDPAIFEACEARIEPHKVTRELLRSQIETNTRVCASVAEAREALRETRRIVIEAAEAHGAAVMGASTHPFAQWRELAVTPKERYEHFAVTFQESIRRLVIGGMHIHAGFGDPESRIRVMTAMRRYLPAIHALSTSSPFNGGHDTGYKSYRLNLIGNLPRTSLPGPLRSRAEFENIISEYRRMNFIESGSEIWWDIRPAHAFPTVELRICDICPRMEDAVSIAALYASLLRYLMRLDEPKARCRPSRSPRSSRRTAGSPNATGRSPSSAIRRTRTRGWTSTTSCAISSRRSRPTPARWGARPNCATRSPSSARAAARTARPTSTACAAWREIRMRRPCAGWWIWSSPKHAREFSERRPKVIQLSFDWSAPLSSCPKPLLALTA